MDPFAGEGVYLVTMGTRPVEVVLGVQKVMIEDEDMEMVREDTAEVGVTSEVA